LRIGAAATLSQYILPPVLRGFRREYPEWLISLELTDTRAAIDRLQEHQLDLAFVIAPPRSDMLEQAALFQDELVLLISPEHPWARTRQVVPQELPTQHFILYSRASSTFSLIHAHFRRQGITPRLSMELANIETIKELVKLNLGITILAPWVA